jgi:hypothetical protein
LNDKRYFFQLSVSYRQNGLWLTSRSLPAELAQEKEHVWQRHLSREDVSISPATTDNPRQDVVKGSISAKSCHGFFCRRDGIIPRMRLFASVEG